MRSWGFIRGAASGFGGAGVWGKKHTVNLYLTMGNYGNKIGFWGTDEILGGVGRSPHEEMVGQSTNLPTHPITNRTTCFLKTG